jgi:hypothetical protein
MQEPAEPAPERCSCIRKRLVPTFSPSRPQVPQLLHATVLNTSNRGILPGVCFKVSQPYVSFSAFPHDRVSQKDPAGCHDPAPGTKFEMQAPGLKEEKR